MYIKKIMLRDRLIMGKAKNQVREETTANPD
jgi:hypothetical protein